MSITINGSVRTLTSHIYLVIFICRIKELLRIVLSNTVKLIFALGGTLFIIYYFLFTV